MACGPDCPECRIEDAQHEALAEIYESRVTPKSCVECGDPADRLCGRRVCGDCRDEHSREERNHE